MKRIDLVREIRNACAYSRQPISLQIPALTLGEVIIKDMIPHLKNQEPKTIRDAFLIDCAFVSHYVLTGEKSIEDYQAKWTTGTSYARWTSISVLGEVRIARKTAGTINFSGHPPVHRNLATPKPPLHYGKYLLRARQPLSSNT